jgi:RimJ/RimL family protein N-acetyltransferase
VQRLISLIHPHNAASQRVAQRLGMAPVGEHAVEGQHVIVFGLDRP